MKNNLLGMNDFFDVLTDFEEKQEKPAFENLVQNAHECINDLKLNFVRLAYYLDKIKQDKDKIKETWSDRKGRYCKDIYDFADQEFNLCKTSVKVLLGILKDFCISAELKEDYVEYSYSQLSEMLPLTTDQRKMVNKTMTVQEIRALKKVGKENGQTSDQNLKSPKNSDNQRFYKLKNKDVRTHFLQNYKNWKLWFNVPQLDWNVYKCELSNGSRIIVVENFYLGWDNKRLSNFAFNIRKQNESVPFGYCMSYSEYQDYMTRNQIEVEFDPNKVIPGEDNAK